MAGGVKEGRPGSKLRNRDALGVIGGETPLLLKLDAETDFEGPRAERSVRSAERAILRLSVGTE